MTILQRVVTMRKAQMAVRIQLHALAETQDWNTLEKTKRTPRHSKVSTRKKRSETGDRREKETGDGGEEDTGSIRSMKEEHKKETKLYSEIFLLVLPHAYWQPKY